MEGGREGGEGERERGGREGEGREREGEELDKTLGKINGIFAENLKDNYIIWLLLQVHCKHSYCHKEC